MIGKVQEKGGFQSEHARWEHAAVYIGKGQICEANKRGVKCAMLSKYAASHWIRVRRDAGLTMDRRYELAIHALTSTTMKYNFLDIIALWKQSRFGFGSVEGGRKLLGPQYQKSATICSQLYADCYVSVTGKILGNLEDGISTPAALSASNTLIDVNLTWQKIVSEEGPADEVPTPKPKKIGWLKVAAFVLGTAAAGALIIGLFEW